MFFFIFKEFLKQLFNFRTLIPWRSW